MKKLVALLIALLLIAGLFAGCTTDADQADTDAEDAAAADDSSADEASTPTTGGTLHGGEYVLDTQMANLNPFSTSGTWTGFFEFMYEEVLFFNQVSGELEPALATDYVWSDDYLTLTLPLNTEAAWTDGEDFTADDVVYTYNVLKDYPVLDQYGIWANIESVAADGDDTVVFTLSAPFTALPNYLAMTQIVPEHIWSEVDPAEFTNPEPVGTGAFIYSAYNTGTDVQFVANESYWRGAPKVDKVVMHIYNSAANMTLALLKGEIQFSMGTLAMPNIPEFVSKEHADMQVYSGLSNFVVALNHENPLLADVAVRQALAMAVKQDDLIAKGEYNGVYPTSIGWLPPLFGENASQEVADSLSFDIDAATAVLEEAGYVKGDDGIFMNADGERLSFTYHNASGAPAQQMEAGMIQQWLLNLGIEIIPKLATWPELTKRGQTGDFDLIQLGIGFPPDPYAALNSSFNSAMTAPVGEATPGTNYFRFRSDVVDDLLAQVENETDPAAQKELYYQIQEEIAANFVFLPMYSAGGHIPYYDGLEVTGWDTNYPVFEMPSLINVYVIEN